MDARLSKPAALVLPRYRFSVGQRLSYHTDCWFPWKSGTEEQTRIRTAWVTDSNPDGSWRVVLLARSASTFLDSAGRELRRETGVRLVYFDMFRDGQHKMNPTVFGADPALFFLQMPADSTEAAKGWQYGMGTERDTVYCTFGGLVASQPRLAAIRVTQAAGLRAAASDHAIELVLFDTDRGLLWRREGKYYSPGEWKGEGHAVGELDTVVVLSSEELARFKHDADVYFKAWLDSRGLMGLMHERPAKVDSLSAAVESVFARTRSQVTDTLILAALNDDVIALHKHVRDIGEREDH